MKACRICKNIDLFKFLSLGKTPLANRFLSPDRLDSAEPFYPLDVYFCNHCGLVQLIDIVPPDILFSEYIYTSGISATLEIHFQDLADEAMRRFQPDSNDLIVEIASNDGTLLKRFVKYNVKTLGIEPARNIAAMARADGIETVNEFFSQSVADKIIESHGKAKIMIATNVLAHIDDLDEVMKAFQILLDENGVIIIEVPYLVNLLQNLEYDTIYHEHLSYFAVRPLINLFDRFGFQLFDIKCVSIHGGSLRVFVRRHGRGNGIERRVSELLSNEAKLRLDTLTVYSDFAKRVERSRRSLLDLLNTLKGEGEKIIGYGAAAKGNTLLNYCGVTAQLLDYIVDRSPLKQGKYTPGTHIPVFPTDKIWERLPDYMLILAWNFAEEVIHQQSRFREKGGKFIIPIPHPEITS